jgi:hypothetical protein
MALLNTHTTIKEFIKYGFSEDQAEVIVNAINDQNTQLVTKNDLKFSISELKSELKSDIYELKSELKSDISKLESDISKLESELKSDISKLENKMDINMKWIMAIGVIIIGILLKNTLV